MPLEAVNKPPIDTDINLLVRFLEYLKSTDGDYNENLIEDFINIEVNENIQKNEYVMNEVARVNKALKADQDFNSISLNDKTYLINNMKEIINAIENPTENKISNLKAYDPNIEFTESVDAMHNVLRKLNKVEALENQSTSQKIIDRLKKDDKSFMAIDNISDYIEEGEIQTLIDEVALKFESALQSLVIDTENDPNSNGTGMRMAKMYINEIMGGRYSKKPKITSFPNDDNKYDQLIFTRTDIKSMCSHHHQPVTGVCYIACLPGDNVIGLSKYSRVAQHLARRGTLQEELTVLIADEIQDITKSKAVGVYIRARHGCCENRGIMSSNSNTQTTVVRGEMKTDIFLKEEFMNNIHFAEINNKGN